MRRLALLLLALALVAAGCGTQTPGEPRPQIGVRGEEPEAAQDLGFPAFATKNTTRVGGADPVADAAAVARAVFPGPDPATRPRAVGLVDADNWQAGIAAAALLGEPIGAPVLLAEDGELPPATEDALTALSPTGAPRAADAQLIRVGDVPAQRGLEDTQITGGSPAELAANLDRFLEQVRGRTTDSVVVVGSGDPRYAMPAAGWAAKSGDPVLFVDRDRVPVPTRRALERHQRPNIYVLGPESTVSARVEEELGRLGTVTRIQGRPDPGIALAGGREGMGEPPTGDPATRDPGAGDPAAGDPATRDRAARDRARTVREVEPGTAAQRAGVRAGDVLESIGGRPISGPDDVEAALESREPGDTTTFIVRRNGQQRTLRGELSTDPIRNSIAFARFSDGDFGWGVTDPGHGLAFVNGERPLDAAAAAPLSASGTYAPLLVHDGGGELAQALEDFLLDIRPGYQKNPVRGVYNHGWIIGDEAAMTTAVQAKIDSLLQILRVEA